MGFVSNVQNDDYRINTMGADNPATGFTPAHWYSGMLSAPFEGAIGGIAAVGRVAHDAVAATPWWALASGDPSTILSGQVQRMQDTAGQPQAPSQVGDMLKAVQDWAKIDPRNNGVGAQVLGATTRGLTIAGLGSLAGGPVAGGAALGITEGYGDYQESVANGLDPNTAAKKAGLTAAAGFAGAFLPMHVGGSAAASLGAMAEEAAVAGNTALSALYKTSAEAASVLGANLGTKMATGAAINTGFGMANRYLTSTLLDHAGYHDMAAQYKVMDTQAILSDVVLGAAFGGWGHLTDPLSRPDANKIDAALDARTATAQARGAGGIPTDLQTSALDAELQDRSLGYLLSGHGVTIDPHEASAIVEGSILDPERQATHQTWVESFQNAFGLLGDGTPSERLGWSDLEGQIPDHLTNRFTEDRRNSQRAVDAVQDQLETLDQKASAVLDRARTQLPPGVEPSQADLAMVMRNFPSLAAEGRAIDAQRATLEGRLSDAQSIQDATLAKWRSFGAVEPEDLTAPRSADEFTARFGMTPGQNFQEPMTGSFEGGAKPAPPTAPGAAEGGPKVGPVAQEQLSQLGARHPDLEVTGPDGKPVRAADLEATMKEHMAGAEEDSKLIDTAIACFLRTTAL